MEKLTRACVLVDKKTGEKHPCNFIINPPVAVDDGANYCCICEITGAPDIRQEVFGYDAIQALELSMCHLQVHFRELLYDFDILYPSGEVMDTFITPNAHLWQTT